MREPPALLHDVSGARLKNADSEVVGMEPQGKLKIAEIEPGVFHAADSISYQQGSIVSKQLIIRKDTGNVTLFAFDEGQGLSEHTAPFDALVHIIEGEAEVTVSKKPYTIRAGEMIVMPADRPHALKATRRFKMLLVMIRS